MPRASIYTIRYGRMPNVRGLCRGLARDVTAMRAQRPDLKVAYLTDGASGFETLYDQHLKTLLGPGVVSLVDFWHAAEYLGARRGCSRSSARHGRGSSAAGDTRSS